MTEERQSAADICRRAFEDKRDEEGRTRAEAIKEAEARHKRRLDSMAGQIGKHAAALSYEPPLAANFPGESWEVVDSQPVLADGRVYGSCQPDVIVTDETQSFYLAVTLNCSGQHHWWAEPVATAAGHCHWRLRDEQSQTNPTPLQIGEWMSEGVRPVKDSELRERARTFG